MKILIINCGSSSLKFRLFYVSGNGTEPTDYKNMADGIIDRIGMRGNIRFRTNNGQTYTESVEVKDHGEAALEALKLIDSSGLVKPVKLSAVGHRVVHGGNTYVEPTLINDLVIETLEDISLLAPLHNLPAIDTIKTTRESLGSDVPMVAVFDTAFHSSMPETAYRYAIPWAMANRYHIRRYGFHGIAHQYMAERCAAILGKPISDIRLITLQLGNGCSVAAIAEGYSIDTSMGFTPLEGLIMGTRCGSIDPSLIGFLARNENVDVEEVERWLNTQSGLLGISGGSKDMQKLLEAEKAGDYRTALAVDMFCYSVRKYIGAYFAALNGADVIVFGGGIGENSPDVRTRICSGLEWFGIVIDHDRNKAAIGTESLITEDTAAVQVYVIPVDEEVVIARDLIRCLKSR
jgi:acetate kinase